MYTLVLMTAMTAAPDAAEFNGFFRNLFGGSCYGSCSGSCSGSCTGSGYGSCTSKSLGCTGSCSGSCHGGHFLGFGSRMRAFSNKSSCYGSCTGHSYACYGSCSGSYSSSCCGGGMPISYAAPADCPTCGGCPSCGPAVPLGVPGPTYDVGPGATIPGTSLPTTPGGIPPAFDTSPAPIRPAVPPPPADVSDGSNRTGFARAVSGTPGRATVVVRLPADAKLYAEDRPLNLISAERTFVTPVLPAGPGYTYTFRAEYVRGGETISQTKRVAVTANGSVAVEFNDLTVARRPVPPRAEGVATAAEPMPTALALAPALPVKAVEPAKALAAPVAGDRARITVKLPPGSTLYVDEKKSGLADGVREFATPPLPAGQEFAYLMKAERVRDGRPEYQVQKVTFRAGEILTVDFTGGP